MSTLPESTARISITDIFRYGETSAKNEKIKRLTSTLAWRHVNQGSDIYTLALADGSFLNIPQISNGESKGLGTGTSVWPAAHVLSKYLEKRYGPKGLLGKRVCDIGSGTGCAGFVAASLGAKVTLTDQDHLLAFMESNKALICSENASISMNQVGVCSYEWGASIDHLNPPFDVVLVSDCVLPKLYPIESLVHAVAAVMGETSTAIFSYEHRPYPYYDPRHEFVRLARESGLEVRTIPISEHDPFYCADDIELWEVKRIPVRTVRKCAVGTSDLNGMGLALMKQQGHFCTEDDEGAEGSEFVRMLSWGALPVIDAIVGGRRVKIRQVIQGSIGCYLWASSVVLSRLILRGAIPPIEDFFRYGRDSYLSSSSPSPFSSSFRNNLLAGSTASGTESSEMKASSSTKKDTSHPLAIDLGAGCGLTSIALLQKGFDVISTDKAPAVDVLRQNLRRYWLENHSDAAAISAVGHLKVVEFDWFEGESCRIGNSFNVSGKLNQLMADIERITSCGSDSMLTARANDEPSSVCHRPTHRRELIETMRWMQNRHSHSVTENDSQQVDHGDDQVNDLIRECEEGHLPLSLLHPDSSTLCAQSRSARGFSYNEVDVFEELQTLAPSYEGLSEPSSIVRDTAAAHHNHNHNDHNRTIISYDDENRSDAHCFGDPSDCDHSHIPPCVRYPDLVVCSDCLYAAHSVQPLLEALNWLCGPQTELLIANELRTAFDEFITTARRVKTDASGVSHYWAFEEVEVQDRDADICFGLADPTANRPVRVIRGRKMSRKNTATDII